MTWVADLGALGTRFVDDLGRFGVFTARVTGSLVRPPARVRAFVDELYKLGVLSFVIITVCGLAVGMVLAAHEKETREEEEESRERADVSVFPLAIPLIAGPGAMASTMILVGQAGPDPLRLAVVFAMAAAVLVLTWIALRLASPLGRVLRRTGVNVVTRVLGVLLAALAVQYVADGVRGLLGAR